MLSKRYTLVLADRTTGVVRRFTVSLKPVLIAVVTVVTLPILIGTGAALKASYEVAHLYASHAILEFENANYRTATEQLAGQIMALQTAMSDLGAKAALDPSLQNSMDKLPAVVKSRAMGGPTANTALALVTPGLSSPENTFGLLKDLLSGLEDRLQTRPQRRQQAQSARGGDAVDLADARLAVVEHGQPRRSVHRREGFPSRPRHLGRQGRSRLRDRGRQGRQRLGGRQLRQPRDPRSRLRPRDALRPPVGVQGQAGPDGQARRSARPGRLDGPRHQLPPPLRGPGQRPHPQSVAAAAESAPLRPAN